MQKYTLPQNRSILITAMVKTVQGKKPNFQINSSGKIYVQNGEGAWLPCFSQLRTLLPLLLWNLSISD